MPYVAARDGRRQRGPQDRAPSVPERLDDLRGHSVGVLELPHHMAAGHKSRRIFDLENPAQQRLAYQTVLCQAADCCEINDLLHPGLLRRLWRHLHIPDRVRQAWEARYPDLSTPSPQAGAPTKIESAELIAPRTDDGFRRAGRRPSASVPADRMTAAQMIAARTASSR